MLNPRGSHLKTRMFVECFSKPPCLASETLAQVFVWQQMVQLLVRLLIDPILLWCFKRTQVYSHEIKSRIWSQSLCSLSRICETKVCLCKISKALHKQLRTNFQEWIRLFWMETVDGFVALKFSWHYNKLCFLSCSFSTVHFKTKIHNPSASYFLILGNKSLTDVSVCCATCSISSNLKFKASFFLESVRQKSVVAKFQKLLRALCIHKQLNSS